MSEIDFKEIEKAMAELVNKAQDKQRQQQLGTVVKKRDEIAKKVETARGQGTVATKRIIIGNKSLRDPVKRAVQTASVVPVQIISNKNPISDFRPVSSAPVVTDSLAPPPLPSQTFEKEVLGHSQQTVGDLSDEYLQEQVSDKTDSVPSPDTSTEPEEVPTSPDEDDLLQEVDAESDPEPEVPGEDTDGVTSAQETSSSKDSLQDEDLNDELPESKELSETLEDPSYDYGSIHKMYGQRMPTNFANHYQKKEDIKTQDTTPKTVKSKNQKPKKSFLNFLVYFLVFASLAVWAGAAYLYFVY